MSKTEYWVEVNFYKDGSCYKTELLRNLTKSTMAGMLDGIAHFKRGLDG